MCKERGILPVNTHCDLITGKKFTFFLTNGQFWAGRQKVR